MTLLVNVWLGHKPAGSAPLPASVASALSRGRDLPSLSFNRPVAFVPVPIEKEMLLETEPSAMVVEAPLGPTILLELLAPVPERLLSTADRRSMHSFVLMYGGGCCSRISTRRARSGAVGVDCCSVEVSQAGRVREQQQVGAAAGSKVGRSFLEGGRHDEPETALLIAKVEDRTPTKRKRSMEP